MTDDARTSNAIRARSLFNVDGGHRAIVYNRFFGIKDKVRALSGRTRGRADLREARARAKRAYGDFSRCVLARTSL